MTVYISIQLGVSSYKEKRSCKITTSDDVVYRKTQIYLKPYTPQNKNLQSTQSVSQLVAQSNHKKSVTVNNPTQVPTCRPKKDTKPPVKLDL